ncbi:hypothetical protein L9F63_007606, partial [Diploptera punctata]
VNSRNEWESLVDHFSLPKQCVNCGVGLKQIYLRLRSCFRRVCIRILGNSLPILRKRRHSCMTVKMALNMQQQITIAAWAVSYANDRETARLRWSMSSGMFSIASMMRSRRSRRRCTNCTLYACSLRRLWTIRCNVDFERET